MRGKSLLLCFLVFSLLLCFVSGADYPNVGGSEFVFNNSGGIFRSTLSTSTTGSDTLSSPKGMPLLSDLNNDGVMDMVVLDGSEVRVYNGGSFATSSSSLADSNISSLPFMWLYDLNGDNLTEILVASSHGSIEIFNYNSSGVNLLSSFKFSGKSAPFNNSINYSSGGTGQMIGGCVGVGDCVLFYVTIGSMDAVAAMEGITKFDINGVISQNGFGRYARSAYASHVCLASFPEMVVSDYDKDGVREYIFTIGAFAGLTANSRAYVWYIDSSTLQLERVIDLGNPFGSITSSLDDCDAMSSGRYMKDTITSPLVAEITGGGQLETVVGIADSAKTFHLYSYKADGSLIRQYPEVFSADGKMISNIILSNVFDNSQMKDFCILGYNSNSALGTLDLLCGSETTVFSFLGFPTIHSDEFVTYLNGYGLGEFTDFGINSIYSGIIHSSPQGFSSGVSDLVTSYGLFSPDFSGINFLGLSSNSSLNLNFISPYQNGSIVMLDADNTGKSDMVVLTQTNLYYINDNFVNSPAQIINISTNPCINYIWLQNTTVRVTVRVVDVDSDAVSARAIFYNNASDSSWIQDSGWSINSSSGANFFFDFVANQSTSTGYIEVFGRDVVNPDSEDKTELLFTVSATTGQSYGDSECSVYQNPLGDLNATTPTTLAGDVNPDDNVFKNAFDNEVIAGWGLGYTDLWLILMVVVALSIWVFGAQGSPAMTFGIVGFVEVLLFVVGVYLDFIGFGVLLTIVVLGLIVLGLYLGKIFSGVSN